MLIKWILEPLVGDARDPTGDCVTNIRDVQRNRAPIIEIIKNMVNFFVFHT